MSKPSQKNKKIPIQFSIKNIELLENSINIPNDSEEFNIDDIKYDISLNVEFDTETSLINFKVNYKFFSDIKDYINIIVLNSFEIKELEKLFNNQNKFIEPNFVFFLAQTSIDQTRGVLSTLISSTVFKDYHIPPILKTDLNASIKF